VSAVWLVAMICGAGHGPQLGAGRGLGETSFASNVARRRWWEELEREWTQTKENES